MKESPISVGGIEIPSSTPLFLTLISIHVLAALFCVVAGVVAMLSAKQHGTHSKAGTTYYYGLLVVFITVIIIAAMRWQDDYHLFFLGLGSYSLAFIGRSAMRHKWAGWPYYHVTCMGFSYIILLTAFYVDNGRFLPIWKHLPVIIYWTLPGIVGIPIILRTLKRHPIVRAYRQLMIKRQQP
jgi:hypothetical protein